MHERARGEVALVRALSALTVVAFGLGTDTFAAEWTGHAVVVGISDYVGTTNDLTWCDDDAREVYDTLLSDSVHWSTDNVRILLNGAATYDAIDTAISEEFTEATGADDVCLFFFSGHGTQVPDEVGPGGDEDDPDDEALVLPDIVSVITDDDLATWFAAHTGKRICAIFDVCRAGGMAKSVDTSPEPWNAGLASDILKALPPPPDRRSSTAATKDIQDTAQTGIVMLMACEDVQLSEEDPILRNGVFSYFIIEALRGRAADADADGLVSAEEAFAYAKPLVVEWNPDQTPDLYDTHAGGLDVITAADRPSEPVVTSKDFPFGGDGCSGSAEGAGGAATWWLGVAVGVAALVLPRRRRAEAVALLALLLSPGCGGFPGREGGGFGLRTGVASPFAEEAAPYSAGPQVGAYYRAPLAREGVAIEFGGDALAIGGDGYDIDAVVLCLRGDLVLSMGDAAAAWVPYATAGGRFFSAGVDTYWGSGYDTAWGLGVALGIGRSGRGADFRAGLDWLPGSGNIGGVFSLTAGWNF